ncbi:MAG: ABC transporter permease [Planctomycetaceae bacterium]|nr:ABC transporter permease [Planctomycetaceae bacterium]
MIPRSFFRNNLRLRPIRTLLTIVSVAGSVAAVVSVLQATAATQIQLRSIYTTFDSPVAMRVMAADASAFSPDDVPELARQPGVSAVIPVFRVFTKILAGGKQARCLTMGTDLRQYQAIRDFTMVSGQLPANSGEVSLEASVADHLGVRPGARIRLAAKGLFWPASKKVTGIFSLSAADAVEETAAVVTTLTDASRLGRAPGKVNALEIRLHDRSEEAAVAERIRAALPEHLIVTKSTSAGDLSRPTQKMIGVGLNVAALLAFVAAVFITFNSFHMSVAERQRQLALMRIVGATAEQVRGSLYREAAFLGFIGTLLGVIPGMLAAGSLTHSMQEVMGLTNMVPVPIQPHAVLAGLLFGPFVTLVSVWHPARSACAVEPLAALKSALSRRQYFSRKAAAIAGVAFLLFAALMFGITYSGLNADIASILAIAAVEVGTACLLPELIRPGASAYFRVMGRFFPVTAQLGHRQLAENFDRTALTVAVLFVVSAASVSVGSTTMSLTGNIQAWMERTITADFLLFASRPTVDMSDAEPLPDELSSRIREIRGIRMTDEITFSLASVNGKGGMLAVQEYDGYETMPIDLIEGDADGLQARLRSGEALLGSVLANLLNVKPGDTVSVEVSGSTQEIRIAAVVREYTAGGLMLHMDSIAARERFPLPPAQVLAVRTDPAERSAVGEELRTAAREFGLIFQSLSDLHHLVQGIVSGITNRLFLILILALVIAAFAIVNSQTMNVIEQTRYLGMLRVVGMLQSEAFLMFLFQSLILGVLGIVPGMVTGLVMSYLTILSFQGVTDHGVAFAADVRLLTVYLSCGLLLSLIAAALPAIRAGRLKPLEAIHEE